ncbi:hypothetical protein GM418_21000 [Maribellus comscasis]|uniref:Thiamin/hydroxymethyl pyrimidine-binding YkoF putative domain-containing protein n=1 Tax=Maribellus comscasis TaxID=2681766 RepID=A0A6I6K7P5_9BACT|nr:YkoF family thiamine/hydroxymethylpyrimidine-binding protein [Maribellus comscasis]QGY46054.1 hypothetical protein GM418_21000 [Maribellus comscasis]
MEITAEISYYPLKENYNKPIQEFIDTLTENQKVTFETGMMSTVISGGYDEVMLLLVQTIKPFMEKYPSLFTLKIANTCKI